MLLWVAVGCALGAVGVAARWWLRPRTPLVTHRIRPFPWPSVSVLAVASVAALVPVVRHHQEEDRLSHVASVLAGVSAHVHCQSASETFTDAGADLGYVRFDADGRPEHSTTIKREPCGDLSAYVDAHGRHPSLDQVVAVHVLTHESMHMAGLTDEAQAECAAVQRDAQTARLLGASDEEARGLARRYWRLVYPDMPDGYRSGDCRPGGALDEGLPDPPW